MQVYALDKATECESVKEALRRQQISILKEPEETPPRPPTPEEIKRHEEKAKESERRCEEVLKRPRPKFESLESTACEVLKTGREDEARLTAEEKAQRQKEWEEQRAKQQADRRVRQAKAQEELGRMEHAKCVPAEAVYGPGVKRQP